MFGGVRLDFIDFCFAGQFVRIGYRFAHGISHIGANRSVQISRRCIGFNFPFGFADCRNNRILESDDFFNDVMTEQNGLSDHYFRQFIGAGFHHQNRFPGSGDNKIQLSLFHLFNGGIDHIFVVDIADTHAGNRSVERNIGYRQGAGCADHGDHIGRIIRVDGNNGGNDMNIISKSIRKQRANGPVNHPGA